MDLLARATYRQSLIIDATVAAVNAICRRCESVRWQTVGKFGFRSHGFPVRQFKLGCSAI
jgi:hypothetical protein